MVVTHLQLAVSRTVLAPEDEPEEMAWLRRVLSVP